MDTKASKGLRYYNDFVSAEDAGDLIGAQQALRRSARFGEPMAFHVMAYYELGKDNPRIKWAIKKYRRAAQADFAPSAWNLALYYKNSGKFKLWEKWMRRAAEIGDPDAAAELKNIE